MRRSGSIVGPFRRPRRPRARHGGCAWARSIRQGRHLLNDLLAEAGKAARWESYDHDEHGFIYVRRNDRGEYRPDALQIRAVQDSIAFLDRYLKAG
jgi:hypothetical protein